jgi:hypothetical protein
MEFVDCGLKSAPLEQNDFLQISARSLVRGFQCSPKVDLNADFLVSIIRNHEFGCLLQGGVFRSVFRVSSIESRRRRGLNGKAVSG